MSVEQDFFERFKNFFNLFVSCHTAAYKGRLHGQTFADYMGGIYMPRRIKFVLFVLTFAIILLAVSTISTIHVYLTKSPRSFLPSVFRIT
jgi:hypothetical protein